MLLWLRWFAAFLTNAGAFAPLSEQATCIAHRWLDRAEWLLIKLVLIRAAQRIHPLPTLKHSPRRRHETRLARCIIGSAMRRSLRSDHLDRRIAALSQNIDILVTRIVKRLPRGLTRRRPILTRPELRAPNDAFACNAETPPVDTS